MKVLFLTHYTEMMGANRSMLQLILELREMGVDITVLVPKSRSGKVNPDGIIPLLETNGISYFLCKFYQGKGRTRVKNAVGWMLNRLLASRLARKLKGKRFDLIHTNSSVIDFGALLARRLEVPHVWHLREFGDLDYDLYTPFGRLGESFMYRGSNNHFIAISNVIKRHFERYIDGSRISVIYNGIHPQPGGAEHTDASVTRFCQVGYISEHKNQMDPVRACAILLERGIRHFTFTIVGHGKPDYIDWIKRFIAEKGLENHVILYGQSDNVNALLDGMDIGIMPSESEAFGRVSIEYMLRRLAVIASDAGANPEIITDRSVGLLYPLHDAEALADHMERLITDRSMMLRVADAAHAHALSHFSSRANSEAIHQFYHCVIDSSLK